MIISPISIVLTSMIYRMYWLVTNLRTEMVAVYILNRVRENTKWWESEENDIQIWFEKHYLGHLFYRFRV